MKIIKIGAVWCGGCLVMNNVWNKVLKKYKLDYVEYDIDFDEDEVNKYNVGDKLPVFIIMDGDKEITRFSGEYNYDDFILKLKGVDVIHEED